MRRIKRRLALALAIILLLSANVLAAKTETDKATLTVIDGVGAVAEFDSTNPDLIHVTVTSSSLVAGQQYAVLMVKCTDETESSYNINSGSLLYIDQKTAATGSSGSANGTISFDVYPSNIQSSVILIAGAEDGLIKIAIVKGKYILGDVNDDGKVNVGDATVLLRYIAGLCEAEDICLPAADVNQSGSINVGDATLLLRVIAGLESLT